MHIVPEPTWLHVLLVGAVLLLTFQPWRRFSSRSGRRREWEHAERMKAMELGHPIVIPESIWPRALVCIAIGALVPVGVFVCAWLVNSTPHGDEGTQGTVWGVSFLVSTVAIGCGTALAFGLLGSRDRTRQADAVGKPPSYDPESFEITNHHA